MAVFLLQVHPERLTQAAVALQALPRFRLVRRVFDYLVLDLPPFIGPAEALSQLLKMPGALKVFPDKPMGIFQRPVVPVNEELARFMRGVTNPFSALPTLVRQFNGERDIWPTGESRRMVGADVSEADGITGKGIKVVVLDTGVDPTHPLTLGVRGESTVQGEPLALDSNGHSTHVITTVNAQRFVHPLGVVQGVAPGAEVLPIKVLGYVVGVGFMSDILAGMERAAQRGAHILNMSLGGSDTADSDAPDHRAVRLLTERGITVVVAAGNSGPGAGTLGSPGSAPDALTIGAVDRAGQLASFSSRGPSRLGLTKPDAVAPGVNIFSGISGVLQAITVREGPRFGAISGSSMSTPHAAAVCALALEYSRSKNKTITTAGIKAALALYGHEKSNQDGWGLITYPLLKRYIDEKL